MLSLLLLDSVVFLKDKGFLYKAQDLTSLCVQVKIFRLTIFVEEHHNRMWIWHPISLSPNI